MRTISIIVAAYNIEAYIERCLKSILSQTYPQIEVIVVDDGSLDATRAIVNQMSKDDSRIKIVSKQNGGLPQARKTGVEYSTGEYLCFVDGDDWVEPDYCMQLYACIVATGCDVAACGYYRDFDNGVTRTHGISCGCRIMNNEEALSAMHRRECVFTFVWNKMFARHVIERIEFPIDHIVGEDYDITSQALDLSQHVVYYNVPLYHYADRNDSMTKSGFNDLYIKSCENYGRVTARLLANHPAIATDIHNYCMVDINFGMLTPMARNGVYNDELSAHLQANARKHVLTYLKTSHDSLDKKGAAVLLVLSRRLFLGVYRICHALINRFSVWD